jgi:hypothetical protein
MAHDESRTWKGIDARRGESDKEALAVGEAFARALVGRTGLEPVTNGLKVRCSTT